MEIEFLKGETGSGPNYILMGPGHDLKKGRKEGCHGNGESLRGIRVLSRNIGVYKGIDEL